MGLQAPGAVRVAAAISAFHGHTDDGGGVLRDAAAAQLCPWRHAALLGGRAQPSVKASLLNAGRSAQKVFALRASMRSQKKHSDNRSTATVMGMALVAYLNVDQQAIAEYLEQTEVDANQKYYREECSRWSTGT
eukprot:jgi/Chlat1/9128/Chrsp97S08389